MEKNKGKVQLSDELLDPISGVRNGNLMDHDENCYVVKTRQLQPF